MEMIPEVLADGAPYELTEPRCACGLAVAPDAAQTSLLMEIVRTAQLPALSKCRRATSPVQQIEWARAAEPERCDREPAVDACLDRRTTMSSGSSVLVEQDCADQEIPQLR